MINHNKQTKPLEKSAPAAPAAGEPIALKDNAPVTGGKPETPKPEGPANDVSKT